MCDAMCPFQELGVCLFGAKSFSIISKAEKSQKLQSLPVELHGLAHLLAENEITSCVLAYALRFQMDIREYQCFFYLVHIN